MDRFSDSDMSAAAYSDNQHQIKKRWTWKPAIWESRGQKEHQLWIRVIVVRPFLDRTRTCWFRYSLHSAQDALHDDASDTITHE